MPPPIEAPSAPIRKRSRRVPQRALTVPRARMRSPSKEAQAELREQARTLLRNGRRQLDEMFRAGGSIGTVMQRQLRLTDQLLTRAWESCIPATARVALVPVGGYGRRELHPGSDLDLLILHRRPLAAALETAIEDFLALLWDMGLQPGHSVRSIRRCVQEARADLGVLTGLMEARPLCGDSGLIPPLQQAIGADRIWCPQRFYAAKLEEQQMRRRRFRLSAHNLEPNVKDGPGGLRDIHMLIWIGSRHFGIRQLRELLQVRFLQRTEYHSLRTGRELLWRIRYTLHMLAGRREDRLRFDYQRQTALLSGYRQPGNTGVEQFMKMYYRNVSEIELLNEILLQQFRRRILPRPARRRPLNRRFQVADNRLEVSSPTLFQREPHTLLEPFLLLQQCPLDGIGTDTARLLRSNLRHINARMRNDARTRSLFRQILQHPRGAGPALERMRQYGVLGTYLPCFNRIEGLMQFDLLHIYSVDRHILQVVSNLDGFSQRQQPDFPLCFQIARQIPKLELLRLAGLFHDIGKGRGGDHSRIGAEEALDFCRYLQLDEYDTQLVCWLVAKHLLMSRTAQREDLDSQAVIHRFASEVGDLDHLNYLYLLTAADLSGTNPALWNSWKNNLISTLYWKTFHALNRGLDNPIGHREQSRARRREVLEQLPARSSRRDLQALWDSFGPDYFLRYRSDEIAWHSQAILAHDGTEPLILVKPRTSRDCTEVFVYMPDQDHIFAATTHTLDRLHLCIVDARIITAAHGYTLDSYSVLEADNRCVSGKMRSHEIVQTLQNELRHIDRDRLRSSRLREPQLRNFTRPARIQFVADPDHDRTIMEVSATDQPGLLSCIGSALSCCGARVKGAKIATYGEQVEDIFFLTGRDNHRINDPKQFTCLRDTLTRLLA